MDRNLLLAFVLSFLVLYSWSAWQTAGLEELDPGATSEAVVSPEGYEGEIDRIVVPERFPELPEAAALPVEQPTRAPSTPSAPTWS